MKTLCCLLLGVGLTLGGWSLAVGQTLGTYQGAWLPSETYSRDLTRLEISLRNDNTASLVVWWGGPSDACRRSVGVLQFWGKPSGLITNLTARQRTGDVTETYQFLALDRNRLRVVYHVARAGALVQCDTLRFGRVQHGRHTRQLVQSAPEASPEYQLSFRPVDLPAPVLLSFKETPRP